MVGDKFNMFLFGGKDVSILVDSYDGLNPNELM